MIGPMGSGKSSVGASLASRLQMQFIDTDQLVTERAGRSITEIFELEGEDAFRKLESEAVEESVRAGVVVIACGGGAVLNPSNVKALRAAGDIFYLRVSPNVAAERLKSSDDRPLVTDWATTFSDRKEAYEQAADFEIDADRTVAEVVDQILAKVEP